MWPKPIGHVLYIYINILTWLRGFQVKPLGVVFFVSKSLLEIEEQRKLEKFAILIRKSRSHARISIYSKNPRVRTYFFRVWQNRFLYFGVLTGILG